jgi:hypothetical protein
MTIFCLATAVNIDLKNPIPFQFRTPNVSFCALIHLKDQGRKCALAGLKIETGKSRYYAHQETK